MPRTLRRSIPGVVWHITHRCHNQAFLLKSRRTRAAWVRWLFEARRRYRLHILNYTVTRNHIHLMLLDAGNNEVPPALQLVAGRTGQAYNRLMERKGAFWESRYHLTAVSTDQHFQRCLAYVDLNMVRAGVVGHPAEWPQGGYHEIQRPKQRYRIIDHNALLELTGLRDQSSLASWHRDLVATELRTGNAVFRQPAWTESIAVGNQAFVESVARELGLPTDDGSLRNESGLWSLGRGGIALQNQKQPRSVL